MLEPLSGNLLQWLRGFCYVVRYDGVGRAAEHLRLEQSAVSHQLRNLENLLNTPLFLRKHKKLVLTEAGTALYARAVPLLQHAQSLLDEMGCAAGELKGRVRLSTTHAVAKHFLTDTLIRFRARHPDVVMEILGGGFGTILNAVLSGEVDFGIISQGEMPDAIISKPLFDSHLLVISPRGNPFGLPEQPTLEDLTTVPFVSFPQYGTVESFLNPIMREKGVAFKRCVIANSYMLLLHYVQQSVGVTILDAFTVEDCEQDFDVRQLKDPLPPRRFFLITREDTYMTPQAMEMQSAILRSPMPSGCTHVS